MKKIIILGSPGAGKSTFSFALAEKMGFPLYHLDQIFWRPGWVNIEKEEFDAAVAEVLKKDAWIIDGNYNRTIPMRLEACDTVFFLDYPRLVCFFGVIRRVLGSYGKVRPDMADGCPERFNLEFLRYTWNFKKQRSGKLKKLLEGANAEIHVFHSRKEAQRYLDGIEKV